MYTPGRISNILFLGCLRNYGRGYLQYISDSYWQSFDPYDIPNFVLPSGFFFSERVSQAATKPRGHKLGIQVRSIEFEGSGFRVLGFNLWRIIVYGTSNGLQDDVGNYLGPSSI